MLTTLRVVGFGVKFTSSVVLAAESIVAGSSVPGIVIALLSLAPLAWVLSGCLGPASANVETDEPVAQ